MERGEFGLLRCLASNNGSSALRIEIRQRIVVIGFA